MFDRSNLSQIGYLLNRPRSDFTEVRLAQLMDTELTFSTKDEYLTWVAEWKKLYAFMTEECRLSRASNWTLPVTYYREQRRAMMALRMRSKELSQVRKRQALIK